MQAAKDFYDSYISGRKPLSTQAYNPSDFPDDMDLIELDGYYYSVVYGFDSVDDFKSNMRSYYTSSAVNKAVAEIGLMEIDGVCYAYAHKYYMSSSEIINFKMDADSSSNQCTVTATYSQPSQLGGSTVTKTLTVYNSGDGYYLTSYNFY